MYETNPAETRSRAPGGLRLARFWPLLWVVWLPILIQPITTMAGAKPAPARLIGILAGVAIFVAIYLWAAWHNDVSRGAPMTGPPEALWLPIVALTAVTIVINLNDSTSGWLTLFIYVSAIAGARRPRIEAAIAVAVLTLLTAAMGLLTRVQEPGLGQTVFLVVVVGAMVIGLGWTVTANRIPRAAVEERRGDVTRDEAALIRTPDQRVRVFVSSTLEELAEEREAARASVARLHLTPVLFELGARPHPPQTLYRSYLAQSDIFVGIYWQNYGWVAPDMDISGLEDEYRLAADKPKLIYVKKPAAERQPRLAALLDRIREDNVACYKSFTTPGQLRRLLENDLALVLSERFVSATPPARQGGYAPPESSDA